MDPVDSAFGHWLAGFADGEGSFYVEVRPPRRGRVSQEVIPWFAISLRADDEAVLRECRRRVGVGSLKRYDRSHSARPNCRPRAEWRVRGWRSCLALIALFDAHPLRAKKARDYSVWRSIVLILRDRPPGSRWHRPDNRGLLELVERLRDGRAYVDRAGADLGASPGP